MNTKQLHIYRPGIIPMLIIVQAIVLVPLWFYMPLWISLSTIALLIAKYLTYRFQIKIPYWVIVLLVLASLAGVYLQFRTISGREAGIGLISLMYAFKLLEAKNYRDAALILFISFFILVTSFLFSETIWMGLYLMLAMVAILMGIIALNSLHGIQGLKNIGKLSGVALLQALPIMILLFFLFPRLPGPLWAMPSDSEAGTGISDSMNPGDIGALHTFDDIAFRVDFVTKAPSNSQMYWRGLVFSEFDGFTWREGERSPLRQVEQVVSQPEYQYKVQLEPHKNRWIFGLEDVVTPPNGVFLFNDHTWRRPQKVNQRFLYQAQSYKIDYSSYKLSDWQKEQNLKLPDASNEKTKKWAIEQYATVQSAQDFISLILNTIRQQPYRYTLTPEILEQEIIDGFWLGTREGFCEHYSSAFVFIMRAAGIPARVVTGYQGGEYNPYGDYYIVRQSDAHAWTEVWLEGEGWRRVDPTAAIHPSRVDVSLQNQVGARDDWFGEFGKESGLQLPTGLLQKLSLRWDALQSFWNETLMGYDQDAQHDWLSKLGIKHSQWRYLGYALLITILLSGLVFGLWILSKSRNRDTVEISYIRLLNKLKAQGFNIRMNEGPYDISSRLEQESPELYAASKPLFEQYIRLRYQKNYPSKVAIQHFKQSVSAFKL
ncbi:MAG: DUF3488 domain-containing transglutaminase family protein [Kangiellaceae bacterium]|nr:DUF3488 domain-containing transglutaminase family protein [Kangiellaceae bacterium]